MQNINSDKKSHWYERKKPWWQLAILDILLAAVVVGIFAFFHLVMPKIILAAKGMPEPIYQVGVTETPAPEYDTEEESLTWRDKFSSFFTPEVVRGENYYSSPDVSIQITEHKTENDLAYFVADIHIADIENFQSGFVVGQSSDSPEKVADDNGAILAMNGDYCSNQREGFLVRNGLLYLTEQTKSDICVLYYDGVVETYGPSEYEVSELMEKDPYQVWKFGPELLDKNGNPKTVFNTSDAIMHKHPRSGFGYYEPGHYCFVVVDGRQPGYSDGINMENFSKLFADLGCVRAFNMDGGASSSMVFDSEIVNKPSGGGRYISDMLIIKEKEPVERQEN